MLRVIGFRGVAGYHDFCDRNGDPRAVHADMLFIPMFCSDRKTPSKTSRFRKQLGDEGAWMSSIERRSPGCRAFLNLFVKTPVVLLANEQRNANCQMLQHGSLTGLFARVAGFSLLYTMISRLRSLILQILRL